MTWIRRFQQKSLFPKFQLIPILHFQVMHDYVHWHCSYSYWWEFMGKLLLFLTEMISASSLWGNVLLRGELQIHAKNSNFQLQWIWDFWFSYPILQAFRTWKICKIQCKHMENPMKIQRSAKRVLPPCKFWDHSLYEIWDYASNFKSRLECDRLVDT